MRTRFASLKHASRYLKRQCGIHCVVFGVNKDNGDDCFLVVADKDNELFKRGFYKAIPEMITVHGVTLPTDVYDCTSLALSRPAHLQGEKPNQIRDEYRHTLITASRGEYVGTANARYGDYAITNHHVAPNAGAEAHYLRNSNWSPSGVVTHSTRFHDQKLIVWWPWLRNIWPFWNTPSNNYLDLATIHTKNKSYRELLPDIQGRAIEAYAGMRVGLDTWQTEARGVVLAVGVDVPVWMSDAKRVIMRNQTIIYWHSDPSKSGDSGGVIFFVDEDGNELAVCHHAWGDSQGGAGGQSMIVVLEALEGMIG